MFRNSLIFWHTQCRGRLFGWPKPAKQVSDFLLKLRKTQPLICPAPSYFLVSPKLFSSNLEQPWSHQRSSSSVKEVGTRKRRGHFFRTSFSLICISNGPCRRYETTKSVSGMRGLQRWTHCGAPLLHCLWPQREKHKLQSGYFRKTSRSIIKHVKSKKYLKQEILLSYLCRNLPSHFAK